MLKTAILYKHIRLLQYDIILNQFASYIVAIRVSLIHSLQYNTEHYSTVIKHSLGTILSLLSVRYRDTLYLYTSCYADIINADALPLSIPSYNE